jgi:hypothetical protein
LEFHDDKIVIKSLGRNEIERIDWNRWNAENFTLTADYGKLD